MLKKWNLSLSSFAERLVINPSFTMSLYCYSILRLDPYMNCSFNCKYCFVKNMPGLGGEPVAIINYPEILNKLIPKISNTPLIKMPFRLSALTDPLQNMEKILKISLKILQIAYTNNLKIILSTKSSLVVHDPWLHTITQLAEKGNIIVQITLITLNEKISKCLEPGAPSPEERLKIIQKLSDNNIPVIVRIQPLIPFLNDDKDSLEELITSVSSAGAKQVIAEYYRFLSYQELADIITCIKDKSKRFKLINKHFWEKFPMGSHKRPRLYYRKKVYEYIREVTKRENLLFSICREDLYDLWTAPNCCGIQFLKDYRLKPTIREIILNLINNKVYIRKEEFKTIPYLTLRTKIYNHYEVLEKYSRNFYINEI